MPLAIPLGALALIGVVTFLVSRVLLNVPKEIATAVALMGAFNILAACTYVAFSSRLEPFQMLLLAGVALFPLLLGGIAAAGVVDFPGEEKKGEEASESTVQIAAQALAFDKKDLTIPAGTEFKLVMDNKEAVPHNVAILKSQGSSEVLFREAPVAGPRKTTWTVKPIPAGEYYFQCDVHPNMNGKVTASEDAGGGGKAGDEKGAGSGSVEIAAQALAFDKKDLTIPADKEFKLAMDNKEAMPHNVAILKSQGSAEVLFREAPVPGPKKTEWTVKPIPAGKYYFQCDVHPNMNGTVTAS
jgi:plastocyanin